MGRPSEHSDRVSTAVRLPKDLHGRLVDAAEKRDLSANLLVCRAVEEFLGRLIPVDEIVLTRPSDHTEGTP